MSERESPNPELVPEVPPVSPGRFLRWGLWFYGGLAGIALLWSFFTGRSLWFVSEAAAERGVDLLRDGVAGLAAALLVILLSREFTRRTRAGEVLARALARTLGPLPLSHVLILAAVSGTAEEFFFRGALQPLLGYVATSLFFGCVHFVPQRDFWPWTLFSIAAGFLLGALFIATGNLLAPLLMHVVVNAVNLHLLVRDYGGEHRPT